MEKRWLLKRRRLLHDRFLHNILFLEMLLVRLWLWKFGLCFYIM